LMVSTARPRASICARQPSSIASRTRSSARSSETSLARSRSQGARQPWARPAICRTAGDTAGDTKFVTVTNRARRRGFSLTSRGPAEPQRDRSARSGRFEAGMRQCSVDRRCAAVNARNRLTSATWARMARGWRLRSAKCRCQVTNSVTARFVGRRTVTLGAYSKSSHSNIIRHCDKLPLLAGGAKRAIARGVGGASSCIRCNSA
jgi:hypothetical protein